MREAILLQLLTLAFVALIAVFGARMVQGERVTTTTDVVGGMVSMVMWVVVAFGSTGVTYVNSATGEVESYSVTPLTWLAVALAAISLLIVIFGTTKLVDYSDVEPASLNDMRRG